MKEDIEAAVATHYVTAGLEGAILRGLERAGLDPDALKPEDLAPVDEFHTAGRLTTQKALQMMPLRAGMHVLDVGCGIGGTARCLAAEHDCRVTGIDLTAEFVEVARALSARMGLCERCRFERASALDLPFEDASFDAAVSFHAAMNIDDRARLYAETARVLKPRAPICFFDVLKGPTPGMVYPVPWAETEATSFLRSIEETRTLLAQADLRIEQEENMRDFAIGYFQDAFARAAAADGPPPLGLHLLTGANAPAKFANYAKALEAHQIEPVIIVARRG